MLKSFSNVIGQEKITNRLEQEIKNNLLPKALLFCGDSMQGRLTTAFELARVLSCSKEGLWNCGCEGCKNQRNLEHDGTIYLGKRNFLLEIQAALTLCMHSPQKAESRYILLRSIQKLLFRFHPVLQPALENSIKKVKEDIKQIKELIAPFSQKEDLFESSFIDQKFADRLLKHCQKVQEGLPQEISVHEIRALTLWAYTSGSESKVLILEGVDSLNLSCANALLKTLEEPPKALTFILLANRRGAVLPTILSRCRIYDFYSRPKELQQEVLKRVFRTPDFQSYSSIRDYLYSLASISERDYEKMADSVVSTLSGCSQFVPIAFDTVYASITSRETFLLFLEKLALAMRALNQNPQFSHFLPFPLLQKWNDFIHECALMNQIYNQNPKALLETLFYRMKKTMLPLSSSRIKREL